MQLIHLAWVDYTILLAYVAFVIGIGWALARYMKSSSDFLTSGHSIPTWVTGLAFISANLGALELVGMAASGAKYGIATAHFYWVGAIPAMIFLAVFMMPFYYGSKARSVPEYLKMRFDERVRALNAVAFAVMTIFASGISMNALAKLLNQLLGWDYNLALWICSGVVLIYVLKGGLTSAIYTEVLQFFMIVLGFAPVVYLGLKDVGGWHAMNHSLQAVATDPSALYLKGAGISYAADAWTTAWKPVLAGPANNPMGVDWFAIIFGLGFVLSFRLLVHQLPCRPARHGGKEHGRRPQYPARRRRAQNAVSVPRHRARHDRRRPDLAPGQKLPHPAANPFAGSLCQGC